jgi:glycosyltransferase involved in cell wall biosynthesis
VTGQHLVLVHDEIGGETGMGRVARWLATTVLEAGWSLTAVGSRIDDDIAEQAKIITVHFRRDIPAIASHVMWAAAAARRTPHPPGAVIHVHSPQLIPIADVMTCHHLLHPAHDHGVNPGGTRATSWLRRGQAWARRALDDRLYQRRTPTTRLTFVSEFLRDQFTQYYGEPFDGTVLPPSAPSWRPVTAEERRAARERFGLDEARLTVGYLGGDDPRKGIDAVRSLDARSPEVELIVAGPRSEHVQLVHGHAVGFQPPDAVIAASDVVLAPALFDAAPVAVLQPLARGIPVVVGAATGWAPAVRRHGAGEVWDSQADLAALVRKAASSDTRGCRALIEEVSAARVRERLFDVYGRVERTPRSPAPRDVMGQPGAKSTI